MVWIGSVKFRMAAIALLILPVQAGRSQAAADSAPDFTNLSLEELMNVEITSASKKPEKLADTAAAVFVITEEDIRRSGARTIPDLLRMAPGIEVARITSSTWAVTARGFNSRFANKLLVLMDGRSVYTPLFSGVFWDHEDTPLEDIERIEVIRGPGAALWGANAVNGVINIITKSARDTQGNLLTGGYGNEERGFGSFRHGGQFADGGYYRAYGSYFNRDGGELASGKEGNDDWDMARAGFRADWASRGRDSFMLQGSAYDGQLGETFPIASLTAPFSRTVEGDIDVSGQYLLGQWRRRFSETGSTALQFYYDGQRFDDTRISDTQHTLDLDFQNRFAAGSRQDIVWGLGYRQTWDSVDNTFSVSLDPDEKTSRLLNIFGQDTVTLIEDELDLAVGSKLEYNNYTQLEIQPSARLLWTPTARQTVWAAVSRAVRTPSRAENDVRINNTVFGPGEPGNPAPGNTTLVSIFGNGDLESEELLAYELGYRIRPTDRLSFDLAAFYNDYEDLITVVQQAPRPEGTHLLVPFVASNADEGRTYGFELVADWQARRWWRLQAAYSYIEIDLDSDDEASRTIEGSSPRHHVTLRSLATLPHDLTFDAGIRYVDDLPALDVDSYIAVDARLGWHPRPGFELALVGQNLFDESHFEFASEQTLPTVPTAVERSIYLMLTLRF